MDVVHELTKSTAGLGRCVLSDCDHHFDIISVRLKARKFPRERSDAL